MISGAIQFSVPPQIFVKDIFNDELTTYDNPKSVRRALPSWDINTLVYIAYQIWTHTMKRYLHLWDRHEILILAYSHAGNVTLVRSPQSEYGVDTIHMSTRRRTRGRGSTSLSWTYSCAFPFSIHADTMEIVRSNSVVMPRSGRTFLWYNLDQAWISRTTPWKKSQKEATFSASEP